MSFVKLGIESENSAHRQTKCENLLPLTDNVYEEAHKDGKPLNECPGIHGLSGCGSIPFRGLYIKTYLSIRE